MLEIHVLFLEEKAQSQKPTYFASSRSKSKWLLGQWYSRASHLNLNVVSISGSATGASKILETFYLEYI